MTSTEREILAKAAREVDVARTREAAMERDFNQERRRRLVAERAAAPNQAVLREGLSAARKAKSLQLSIEAEHKQVMALKTARILKAALADVEEAMKQREELVELLLSAHAQCEPSLIECRDEFGTFKVKSADGRLAGVCETRQEALRLLRRVVERERAENSATERLEDNARRLREHFPEPGGHRGRAKKQARLM